MRSLPTRVRFSRLRPIRLRGDAGMATAEYAVGTCAAAGFGGLLFKLLTSDSVSGLLQSLITKALSFVF